MTPRALAFGTRTTDSVRAQASTRAVAVFPTGRLDKYRRALATPTIDGEDLGGLLAKNGLAHWSGGERRLSGAAVLVSIARLHRKWAKQPQLPPISDIRSNAKHRQLPYKAKMVDNLTPAGRSARMSRIRGKDTAPEMIVRRMTHGLGYRFRLHRKDLPGTPDLVFPRLGKVILVHGCYWHGHGCKIGRLPKSNIEFWKEKIERNRARDARNLADLSSLSWKTLVVWQCATRDKKTLGRALAAFLGTHRKRRSTGVRRIARI
jgi:DNA mismatch endonuclease (patch repair protein)